MPSACPCAADTPASPALHRPRALKHVEPDHGRGVQPFLREGAPPGRARCCWQPRGARCSDLSPRALGRAGGGPSLAAAIRGVKSSRISARAAVSAVGVGQGGAPCPRPALAWPCHDQCDAGDDRRRLGHRGARRAQGSRPAAVRSPRASMRAERPRHRRARATRPGPARRARGSHRPEGLGASAGSWSSSPASSLRLMSIADSSGSAPSRSARDGSLQPPQLTGPRASEFEAQRRSHAFRCGGRHAPRHSCRATTDNQRVEARTAWSWPS